MAQRDKDSLKSESSSLFPDNTAQEITPARKRSFDSDMVDSNLNLVEETEQEIAGPVKFVENIAIDFTAEADDDDFITGVVNAGGFTSISALDLTYNTGAMETGDTSSLINLNINASEANGGSLSGMFVNVADFGSLSGVSALAVGNGVRPLIQLLGSPVTLTVGLVQGVDQLANLTNDAVTTNVFVSNGNTLVIGAASKFGSIRAAIATGASKSLNLTWEYSTGAGTWQTFTVGGDSTNNFQQSGLVYWGEDSLATWATSSGNYLIRVTRNESGVSQVPVVQELLIDAVSFFEWDKDGNLHVNSLEMADCPQGAGSEPTGLSAGTVWANSSASIGNSYPLYITTTDT